MKYTLICFTFNKSSISGTYNGNDWSVPTGLQLRNNWIEYAKDVNHLSECLFALGFRGKMPEFTGLDEKCVKLSGDFTLPNTRIIVHIIKNS